MSLANIPEWMIPVNDKTDYRNMLFSESVDIDAFQLPLKKALQEENLKNAKNIVWKKFAGQPYYLIYSEDLYNPQIVNAHLSDSVGFKKFTKDEVIIFLSKDLNIPVLETQWLTTSDEYFKYKNKNYNSILKVSLNNTDNTILYLDLNNLKLLKVSNKNTRLRRWLYKGLHSFDFSFFEKYRWLRETWLILLSIGGTIISLTSLILGYRYFDRKKSKYLRKRF
ncbi:hypothetical protein [Saccharicrinis fermentans]|uniref:PepSY-associated TM helix n=1 Tax=Saccharicrinis fermentans DSM 9555 = JCM 21142 TaxID=869213 RepID=W7XYP2_9BACT|nr:hypothetical protein [Saccharicrinis fermentans]GAF03750.1 hypothetical protein JCM21142_62431 [Saccharicrinis fermentans DSM 9555 = JCM 21142]